MSLPVEETNPLDVWLRFVPCNDDAGHDETNCDCDDMAEYEANTYRCAGGGFTVEWYHTAVGQVSSKWFPTYEDATAWLESEGFQDFSS